VLGIDAGTSPDDALQKAKDGPSAEDTTIDLRQCDSAEVADVAGDVGIVFPNTDVAFTKPFPADNCDPWLSNFQKILTDGDPDQTGTLTEAAFQSFVPNLVQIRGRVATGDQMADLQPVRLNDNGERRDTANLNYTFFVPDELNVSSPDDIIVTAKMRVRHLPPYFVEGLAAEQQNMIDAGFNVPEGAQIFDDENHPTRLEDLLSHMTVTEAGAASSPESGQQAEETLACDKGAQNIEGGSILDCVDNDTPQFTVKGPGFAKDGGSALPSGHPSLSGETASAVSDSGPRALGSTLAFALLTPFAWWRWRRRRV